MDNTSYQDNVNDGTEIAPLSVEEDADTSMYPKAPEYLSFPKFSAFAIPYMLLMEAFVYIYLVIVYLGYLRPNSETAKRAKISSSGVEAAKKAVNENIEKLGSITLWEIVCYKMVALYRLNCLGGVVASLYGCTPGGPGFKSRVRPSLVIESFCLVSLRNSPELGSWRYFTAVPRRARGGFALSNAAKKEYTDLNGKIGILLKNLKNLPNLFIILLIIIFTVFTTNFASNVAVCNVIAPIAMQLAKEINQNPLWYNIATGFSSSYALCLPVGTPGNLVVQGAANIPTSKMIKAGIGPTISTIIITWLAICFWAPVVWPDLKSLPDWIE
ncbi:unnamed protein product, partial [Brenthis ino]